MFKELGDLPPEALAALGQQAGGLGLSGLTSLGDSSASASDVPSSSNIWQGATTSLSGDGSSTADLSSILGTRTVREVIVVRNNRPRPKRGGAKRNLLLFITDKDDVLLYNVHKKLLKRVGTTHKPILARAIELSNHKFNLQTAE